MKTTVLSLGGSIIAPKTGIDTEFLKKFVALIEKNINEEDQRFILVCGGGSPARQYQLAYRSIVSDSEKQDANLQDWLGIRATHLNAQLVKSVFGPLCKDEVVTNPTDENVSFEGKILVAGGWKPGFSTDTDAVYLAQRFNSKLILNLSNIDWVYDKDPNKYSDAVKIEKISWSDFRKIVGDKWEPGTNAPFDPIASKIASENNMKVICTNGTDLENLSKIFHEQEAKGTVIG